MIERNDFHVHYEGEDIFETVNTAKISGIKSMALIGRLDIEDNLKDVIEYGRFNGIEIFSGVECPVRIDGHLVDLVCIGFDPDNESVKSLFGKENRRRKNTDVAICQKKFLESKGFKVEVKNSNDQLLLQKLMAGDISEKAIRFSEIVAKNPINIPVISGFKGQNNKMWTDVREIHQGRPGYENEWQLNAEFLWKLFFDFGKEGYMPIQRNVEEVIDCVHSGCGVVIYSPEGKFNTDTWEYLYKLGIDGIMGWHGGRLEIDKNIVVETRKRGLLILGGSDFNPGKREWKIGVGDGTFYMSRKRVEEFKSYVNSKFIVYKK